MHMNDIGPESAAVNAMELQFNEPNNNQPLITQTTNHQTKLKQMSNLNLQTQYNRNLFYTNHSTYHLQPKQSDKTTSLDWSENKKVDNKR